MSDNIDEATVIAILRECRHYTTPVHYRYDRFRILRDTIYGKVFVAHIRGSTNEEFVVAIKISDLRHIAMAREAQRAEDPLHEATVARHLTLARDGRGHQCVVRLYETTRFEDGLGGGGFATVLELCLGGELFDFVSKLAMEKMIMPEQTFARIARCVTRGLLFMHRQGWAHLDVKPENVLLSDANATLAKLCDFGMARARLPHGQLFQPGPQRPGTVAYMAPEVYAGKPFDHRADIFSLGTTLFVTAFGVPPWEVADPADQRYALVVINRDLNGLLVRWKLRNRVSDDVVDLLQRMLALPDERISLEEMLVHPALLEAADPAEDDN